MRACKAIVCLAVLSILGCVTPERILGHRIVQIEKDPYDDCKTKPYLWIAMTNTSVNTLSVTAVEVIGVDSVSTVGFMEVDWEPGKVRLLKVEESFNCSIPILVNVTYRYQNPDNGKWKEARTEPVPLSGIPTKLPLNSLLADCWAGTTDTATETQCAEGTGSARQ